MQAIQKARPGAFTSPTSQILRFYSVLSDTTIPEAKRKHIPTSGTYPKGFLVSGTHVGVKESNTTYPDLALITSVSPCTAAAVFTTNRFQAAPVQVSKAVLEQRGGQGLHSVVINAGCANAVTGKGGLEDARSMGAKVDECGGLNEPSTLVMSTGVIGQRYLCSYNLFQFNTPIPTHRPPDPLLVRMRKRFYGAMIKKTLTNVQKSSYQENSRPSAHGFQPSLLHP
jgi:hypothetical protein